MKRQFFATILLLISFCFIFSTKSYAADCATDQDCVDNGSSLLGCAYVVSGLSTDWYCQTAHPELNFCSTDAMCTPSDPTYNDDVVGCQSVGSPARWTCRAIRTPAGTITPYTNPVGIKDIFCESGKRDSGIMTALGCIKTSGPNDLITSILRIATGVGGGIALALILYGVFIVTTSAGMPDKLKAGSEIITSAIIGLIFILLSVFLINLIGINILGLPGLSNTL